MLKKHSLIIMGVLLAIILAVSLSILRGVEVRTDNFRVFYRDHITKALDAYNDSIEGHLSDVYSALSKDKVFVDMVLNNQEERINLNYKAVDYMLTANKELTLLEEGGGSLMADMMLTDVFNDALQDDVYRSSVTEIDGDYYYISAGPLIQPDIDVSIGAILLAEKIDQRDLERLLSLTSSIVEGKIVISNNELSTINQIDQLNVSHKLADSDYYLNGEFNLKPYNDYIRRQCISVIFNLIVCSLIGGIIVLLVLRRVYLKIEQLNHTLDQFTANNFDSELDLSGYDDYSLLNGIATSALKINDNRKFRIDRIDQDNTVIHQFIKDAYSANRSYSNQHQSAVPRYSEVLCKALDLKDYSKIIEAAKIHDIGVMTIPRYIMDKPSLLTRAERDVVEHHVSAGQEYIAAMRNFKDVAELVGSHHENWDGSGYPNGLKGEEIPLGAQIIGLADVYDALTNDRPHRPANTHEQASIYILENTGKKFSPCLVEAFKSSSEEFKNIRRSLN